MAAFFLFGSIVRGEAREDSDIDLIVDFAKPVGLFDFIGLQERLCAVLGRRVDLVTRAALKPRIRDRVLQEAVRESRKQGEAVSAGSCGPPFAGRLRLTRRHRAASPWCSASTPKPYPRCPSGSISRLPGSTSLGIVRPAPHGTPRPHPLTAIRLVP